MASTLIRRQTDPGLRALFSAFFPVQGAATAGKRMGRPISAPVKAASAAARYDPPTMLSRLKQEVCSALVVLALASGLGVLLAAYNLRDSIEAQAQQLVMFITD